MPCEQVTPEQVSTMARILEDLLANREHLREPLLDEARYRAGLNNHPNARAIYLLALARLTTNTPTH